MPEQRGIPVDQLTDDDLIALDRKDEQFGSIAKIAHLILGTIATTPQVAERLATQIYIATVMPNVKLSAFREPLEHLNYLSSVLMTDLSFIPKRDQEYGASWKKRGGTGAMHMLLRKSDRLETGVKNVNYDIFEFLALRPDRIDDVQDLRRYLALVESEWLRRQQQGQAMRSG